jgi:D-methionine transport system permease protein
MNELLRLVCPNVIERMPELLKSTWQTLYLMLVTSGLSLALGLFLGVVLTVTKKGGILERVPLWAVLDKVVNFFRSVPFIILIALLIPVTRAITGTAIGVRGAVVPLVFGTVPFLSRQMENALAEVDYGAIEAALAMGTSPLGIIFRVYLRECVPGIIRGVTITLISMIGLIAMVGAVGGGGLGDFAIRYGYQRYMTDITITTVIVLIAIVTVIQSAGSAIADKMTR